MRKLPRWKTAIMFLLLALFASSVCQSLGSQRKVTRAARLTEILHKLQKSSLNEFTRLCDKDINVVEYQRLYAEEKPSRENLYEQLLLLIDRGEYDSRVVVTLKQIKKSDAVNVKRLYHNFRRVLNRTVSVETGDSLHSDEIPGGPYIGILGSVASNVKWIVEVKEVKGVSRIVAIRIGCH